MLRASANGKRVILGLLLTLIILVSAALLFIYFQVSALSKSLDGTNVDRIIVGSRTYKVSNGETFLGGQQVGDIITRFRVLKLAAFFKKTTESPILGSTEVNAEGLGQALQDTAKAQNELKIRFKLDKDVLPVNFLFSFAKTSADAKNFNEQPTDENAKKLLDDYQKTQSDYARSIDSLRSAIERSDNNFSAIALGSSIDKNLVLADLGLMNKNADALASEIRERSVLYSWGMLGSERHAARAPESVSESIDPQLLPTSYLHVESQYLGEIGDVYLVKTACFDGENQEKPLYAINTKYNGKSVMLPKEAATNYYSDATKDSRFNKILLDQGLNWKGIREGNTYLCFDDTYQAKLLNLKSFLEKFPRPLSEVFSEHSEDLGVEQSFYNQKYKQSERLEKLAESYRDLYETARDPKNSDYRKMLLERYLFVRNKVANIEFIFNTRLYLDNFLYLDGKGLTNRQGASDYLYYIRSTYSLSYLNFSPLVWRLEQQPKYMYSSTDKNPNKNFQQLIDDIGLAKVLKINEFFQADLVK